MPKNSMMCSDVMKLKMMIIATLALGAIASQHAQAHDQWAVGISIGNPYPPAVAYNPSAPFHPGQVHPAQRNFFYGPQVFGPPVDLGPTTYIYRAPRVVYGPVIAQPYIGHTYIGQPHIVQPYVAQPFIGRSFGGRYDGYRGSYRGHHRGRQDR